MADDNTILGKDVGKPGAAAFLGKKALLIVLSGNHFGQTRVIDAPRVVIGRSAECGLAIPDPLLSRRHCAFTTDGKGGYYIEDLGSTNATLLNNRKISEKTRLQYGDRIVLGNTIVRFYLEEEMEKKGP
jgi:pSer/pThr/pTyr-binding forkhead associated (FHA) protein